MSQNPAIENLIARWEKRIELNEMQPCSLAERARRRLVNTVYRLVIDELRAATTEGG
jgi:phage baseplate assembly protein W